MAQMFFKKFEGINALVSYLDNTPTSSTFDGKSLSSQNETDPAWYGYNNYEEARDLLLRGDAKLAKKVYTTGNLNMKAPMTGVRNRVVTRVAGFAPHVPNYIAGAPDNMLFVEKKKQVAPVVTIVYNVGVAGGVSGRTIETASARLLSAICSLERKNIRCNLYIASAQKSSDESQRCGLLVKIKDAGQYMDTLKMALPMISPAMNRRFGFRFRETMEGLSSNWVGRYGHSLRGKEFNAFLDDNRVKYDIAIAFMDIMELSTVEELEKFFEKKAAEIKKK